MPQKFVATEIVFDFELYIGVRYERLLFTEYPEVQVKAAVSLCVRRRAFSEEAVLNVLRNEPLPQRAKLDLSDRPELANQGDGARDTGIYDQLKDREEVLV